MTDRYRIRWATKLYDTGFEFSEHRMCRAERRGWFFWRRVECGEWRFYERDAAADIARDSGLVSGPWSFRTGER